jgi:cell division protein FtsB
MTLNFLPVANVDPDLDTYEALQERIYTLQQENTALKRQIAELRAAVEVLLAPAHDEADVNIR